MSEPSAASLRGDGRSPPDPRRKRRCRPRRQKINDKILTILPVEQIGRGERQAAEPRFWKAIQARAAPPRARADLNGRAPAARPARAQQPACSTQRMHKSTRSSRSVSTARGHVDRLRLAGRGLLDSFACCTRQRLPRRLADRSAISPLQLTSLVVLSRSGRPQITLCCALDDLAEVGRPQLH